MELKGGSEGKKIKKSKGGLTGGATKGGKKKMTKEVSIAKDLHIYGVFPSYT